MFKQCVVLCISEKLFMNVTLFKISKSSHKGQASYIIKRSRKSSCLNSTTKILNLVKVDKNNKAMSVYLAKNCFFVKRCSWFVTGYNFPIFSLNAYPKLFTKAINGSKYSRLDQVKIVEDSLLKIWNDTLQFF